MKNYAFFLFTSIVVWQGCKKTEETPVSCFTQNKSTIMVNETIQFGNCSSNADKVKWEFGDGTSSADFTPTKSYSSAGVYNVKLTVYSASGNQSSESQSVITVNDTNGNVNNNPGPYTRFFITKVEIMNFPPKTPAGQAWDGDSGPDMFVSMVPAGSAIDYSTDELYSSIDESFNDQTQLSQLYWNYINAPREVVFPGSGAFRVDVYLQDNDGNFSWYYGEVMSKMGNINLYDDDFYGKPQVVFSQGISIVRFSLTWQ